MKKLVCYITIITILLGLFDVPVMAQESIDYKSIYMEFAKDADENSGHDLRGTISGVILIDLNGDSVPELLSYSKSVMMYNDKGERVPGASLEEYSYEEVSYCIEKAFYIKEGKVITDSLWNKNGTHLSMPYLPDEMKTSSNEELCWYAKDEQGDLCLAVVINEYPHNKKNCYKMMFDGEQFIRTSEFEGFDVQFVNLPVAIASGASYQEKMRNAIEKYENYSYLEDTITTSGWAKADVERAISIGIVPEQFIYGTYGVFDKNITREEFVSIAVSLYEKATGEDIYYKVERPMYIRALVTDFANSIYKEYIEKAYYSGITTGLDDYERMFDIRFGPDFYITREQLATMLTRVVRLAKFDSCHGDESFDISDSKAFADDKEISDYAKESVYYMSKNSVIKGVGNNVFNPHGYATREQAVVMALRLYDAFESMINEEYTYTLDSIINMPYCDFKAKFGTPNDAFNYNGAAIYQYKQEGPSFGFENAPVLTNEDEFLEPLEYSRCVVIHGSVSEWLGVSVDKINSIEDVKKYGPVSHFNRELNVVEEIYEYSGETDEYWVSIFEDNGQITGDSYTLIISKSK